MLLVTGGHTGQEDLASTEVYRPSAGEWREVPGGALPRPMVRLRVVSFNNRVLLFGEKIILTFNWVPVPIIINLYLSGGSGNFRDADILEFSDSLGEEKWTRVGEMSKTRSQHGVSVVDFGNFKDHCQ